MQYSLFPYYYSAAQQRGAISGQRELEAGYPPIQEIEEYHDSFQEGDDKDKNKKVKTRHIRTDTQIFRYAYSQLEKEKAEQQQDKYITFSEIIAMAVDNGIKRRPTIEISFRNLTVTLKQKKRRLLRSVTGEILPGRITALMGPSGAGKTTLLSALAGKTVGCSITGLVLINGRAESISSYKKIVGFVPQDDVVHGNLTVEENIWFSANCRYEYMEIFTRIRILMYFCVVMFELFEDFQLIYQKRTRCSLLKESLSPLDCNQCETPWLAPWRNEASLEDRRSV